MKTVYLAGQITGSTFAEATQWRNYARDSLYSAGIVGLSPMRGKEYLEAIAKDTPFTADGDKYAIQGPLSTNRGIMTRDRFDTMRCDVLLANLTGVKKVSIGTTMEIAWADSNRTPIVCMMEPGNPHEHGMIMEAIGFRVTNPDPTAALEEALHLCKVILNAKAGS